jgi:hypothetical protein
VIDEISMVGIKVFMQVDSRLKQIFGNEEPFGGISLMVLGDFRQLQPVKDTFVFQPIADKYIKQGAKSLSGTILWDSFKFFELTEIMRQRDDKRFAKALNNMADGAMTPEQIQMFQERTWPSEQPTFPAEAVRLFYTNDDVQRYNSIRLANMPGLECTSKARDRYIGTGKDLFNTVLIYL